MNGTRSMLALPRWRGTASSWNKLAEQLFLGWPERSATRRAIVWEKRKASVPQPPEVSTARGRKRMPTVWQSAVLWALAAFGRGRRRTGRNGGAL
jgi:hypothetical protein